MTYRVSLKEALAQLEKEPGKPFTTLMRQGTMSVEYYRPEGVDLQTPHKQDELYLIASGWGTFMRNGEKFPFQTGDVLFVPAGMDHRFEDFSPDFATWVIFYGPDGGER